MKLFHLFLFYWLLPCLPEKLLQSKVLTNCRQTFLVFICSLLFVVSVWFCIFVVLVLGLVVGFFWRKAVKLLYVQLIVSKTFCRTDIVSEGNLRGNYSIYQLHSFYSYDNMELKACPNICHKLHQSWLFCLGKAHRSNFKKLNKSSVGHFGRYNKCKIEKSLGFLIRNFITEAG